MSDSTPAAPHSGGSLYALHRSLALTDGIVAISVTLLALDLKPNLRPGASSEQLEHYLVHHAGQYASYALAFWLIARFWLIHHRLTAAIRTLDTATVWANILFLFTITCLPLTTYITGDYSSPLATAIFAGNLLAVSLVLALFGELAHTHKLIEETGTDGDRLLRRWRAAGVAAVPALVIALAWVLPHAQYLFLLTLLADVPARLVARRRRAQLDRVSGSSSAHAIRRP